MSPQRIQRKRSKGWRMPEGAVYVGRPSRWGNPFRIGETYQISSPGETRYGVVRDNAHAVDLFQDYLNLRGDLVAKIGQELRGRDLACWCPAGQPCHADVLLRIANEATA